MGICLACIGYYILVRVVGIIHLQWTNNGKYCIGRKTNDNMSMAEYVADVDECDQPPYGERDKATNPGSKVGEWFLQSPGRDQPNW